MKYIKTDNLYMVEDFKKILPANPYLDYSKQELNFRKEDIAFIRIKHFKPLDKRHYNVEVHNKKELIGEETFFAISDTPLNIISNIMLYKKFNEMDLMPILRWKHFAQMMERFKEPAKDLSKKNKLFSSFLNSKKEYGVLLFNEETQETLADYLLLDNNVQNENIWSEYAEKGFFPVYFELKKEIEEIYQGFQDVFNKKVKVEKEHYYLHPYNSLGNKELSELEKDVFQNRFLQFKKLFIQKYERLKKEYLSKEKNLEDCIEALDISIEVFDELYEEYIEFKEQYCFDENIVVTINLLSLGEYSFEKLDEMQDIYIRTLKEYDEIKNRRDDYFQFVDESIQNFKNRAVNNFIE